jgi:hypothetical protein
VPNAKYDAAWKGWTRLFGPESIPKFRKLTQPLLLTETLGAFLRAAQAYQQEHEPGRATSLAWFVQSFQRWLELANRSPAEEWPGYAASAGIQDVAAFNLNYRGRLLEQDLALEDAFAVPVHVPEPEPTLFDPHV